jgi:hypothetical protein
LSLRIAVCDQLAVAVEDYAVRVLVNAAPNAAFAANAAGVGVGVVVGDGDGDEDGNMGVAGSGVGGVSGGGGCGGGGSGMLSSAAARVRVRAAVRATTTPPPLLLPPPPLSSSSSSSPSLSSGSSARGCWRGSVNHDMHADTIGFRYHYDNAAAVRASLHSAWCAAHTVARIGVTCERLGKRVFVRTS